jgi:hypothetical protein
VAGRADGGHLRAAARADGDQGHQRERDRRHRRGAALRVAA